MKEINPTALAPPASTEHVPVTTVAGTREDSSAANVRGVTARAFWIGLFFTAGIAWLNCLFATKYQVHMIGGIQMPFGSIFILLFMVLGVNSSLRILGRLSTARKLIAEFSPAELLTIYSMSVIGALISTPGCDNMFLVSGPALFYFATPENRWAQLFNEHVPAWFAPGWNGSTHDKSVIDPVYLGGVPFGEIPWSAWAPMLFGWSVFLGFSYALMFFTALLFRKQWTQYEALTFPLVEIPMQMASGDTSGKNPPSSMFWGNSAMWAGLGIALFLHLFKGMNALFPDWPIFPVNAYGGVRMKFTEQPWSVFPFMDAKIYLGGLGLAYLLTREISFSFWFFYLLMGCTHVAAQVTGFRIESMGKVGILGRPDFIMHQSTGAWIMMALVLIWTARQHITRLFRQAFANQDDSSEPYSPRFIILGVLLSCAGLIAWSWFAGINLLMALTFLVLFLLTSLVITRLVIEGGFMFPQPPYYALQAMSHTLFNPALNAASLTKLSFVQPMLMVDMRTCILPAFLHTMKIAELLHLDRKHLRRLLAATVVSLALTLLITDIVSLQVLYQQGGLASYTWFSKDASIATFNDISNAIRTVPGSGMQSAGWMLAGAALVSLIILGRSRFLWFPLHPLGYLVATAYPIIQLWFSFFLGWLIKSMVMKYGGSNTYVRLRPFMIGLVIGNVVAMLFWSFFVFWKMGAPVIYWPA